jgi:2-keto-3-deoxy-6-phosphogluconate aldolase
MHTHPALRVLSEADWSALDPLSRASLVAVLVARDPKLASYVEDALVPIPVETIEIAFDDLELA